MKVSRIENQLKKGMECLKNKWFSLQSSFKSLFSSNENKKKCGKSQKNIFKNDRMIKDLLNKLEKKKKQQEKKNITSEKIKPQKTIDGKKIKKRKSIDDWGFI